MAQPSLARGGPKAYRLCQRVDNLFLNQSLNRFTSIHVPDIQQPVRRRTSINTLISTIRLRLDYDTMRTCINIVFLRGSIFTRVRISLLLYHSIILS